MITDEVFQDSAGLPVDGLTVDPRSYAKAATVRRRHLTLHNAAKTFWFNTILISVSVFSAFVYGVAVGKYKVFPFEQIQMLKNSISPKPIRKSKHSMYVATNKPRTTQFEYVAAGSDIVMIGDSITQFGLWNEIFPTASIANRGVEGDTAKDVLGRMDTILSVSPSQAFIMIGANDINRSFSIDEIFADYVQIVEILKSRGIDVVVQSTLECSLAICGNRLEKVRALNKKLVEYTESNGLLYVNINSDLTSEDEGLLERYSFDGVHVLGEGYAVWAKAISPWVRTVSLPDDSHRNPKANQLARR